jgi:hypothetical protein
MVAAGAGLTQQLWTGVAADQEGRNLGGKCPAQSLDDFNAGFSAGQMVVGDNQVWRTIAVGNSGKRFVIGSGD